MNREPHRLMNPPSASYPVAVRRFIKEKGLVTGESFIENQFAGLPRDYDRVVDNPWYRAVLPNLFFATINTLIHTAN